MTPARACALLALPIGLLALGAPSLAEAPPLYPTHHAPTSLGQVAYWDIGEGERTAMLVHGLPTSKELWQSVVPQLEGIRLIVPDLIGFGESDKPERPLVHEERALALEELREHLGLERFSLVAHDLGASVAVQYMGAHGESVERLVLMSSPVYPDFEEPARVELVRRPLLGVLLIRLAPRLLFRRALRAGMVHDDRLPRDYVDHFARVQYPGVDGAEALWRNMRWGTPEASFREYPAIMRGIGVPTLMLHGEEDPFIPAEHARRMVLDIPGSMLVMIGDASHFLPLDVPDVVAEALDRFLVSDRPLVR